MEGGVLRNIVLLMLWCAPTFSEAVGEGEGYPIVISTWPFVSAVRSAWNAANEGMSAVDAVVEGCSACEKLRCDGTVGPGGSPDENGETTLDAMVMNGVTMEVGAVAALRNVEEAIRAAKFVMKYTKHTLLVGSQASAFAIAMGLSGPKNLSSPESLEKWTEWKINNRQPNFWREVTYRNRCGSYHKKNENNHLDEVIVEYNKVSKHINYHNHDTISMVVIDKLGHIAAGTSTNGATFKIPGSYKGARSMTQEARSQTDQRCFGRYRCFETGRSGSGTPETIESGFHNKSSRSALQLQQSDGPIAGSGAYADQDVGACGATGDGDVMMRFLPCYQVVESMRQGMSPKNASSDAIMRIKRKYPDFVGAVFAINMQGLHAGACHGWTFQYSVKNSAIEDVDIFTIYPDM